MRTSNLISRLRASVGLDFNLLSTLLFRSWTIVAGGVTVVLLPLRLSPIEQGYYYTFASILALQIFFELGLNQIIVQLVSHEIAHLTRLDGGELKGDQHHIDRFASLTRMIRHWYGVAATLFAVGAGGAGLFFFLVKGELSVGLWIPAWLILVVATATNLFLSPGLAVMEGMGRIGEVAQLRLLQSLIGYFGLWTILFCGGGLLAAGATAATAAVCSSQWLRTKGKTLRLYSRIKTDPANRIIWRHDVFPLQWRIAVSWISGYFIFNLFTPLVFSNSGAVEAGRVGLALTIFNAISTVGTSWVTARGPQLTMHIARGERSSLDALFSATLLRSGIATAFLCLSVLAAVSIAGALGFQIALRIASPTIVACLALVTICNCVIFALAMYMRAHREEPMLPVSVVTAGLTATAAFLGAKIGTTAMIALYVTITVIVALPWTVVLFQRYKSRTI